MSRLFASGGQIIRASFSASVLPMNIQGWSPLRLTGLIFFLSKGLSTVFSSITIQNINSSALRLLYGPTLTSIHDYWKTVALTIHFFVVKMTSLLFNTLSMCVIAFLPRSKRLLISGLQSLSAVILEPEKIKSATVSSVSLSICHEVMGLDAIFWMLNLSQIFHPRLLPSSNFRLCKLIAPMISWILGGKSSHCWSPHKLSWHLLSQYISRPYFIHFFNKFSQVPTRCDSWKWKC